MDTKKPGGTLPALDFGSLSLGSALVYLAARQYGWNLPSYPSGVWYFNPFTWQLLFVLGAWLVLGGAGRLAFLIQSRFVLFLGVVYLLFALVMTLVE